MSVRAVAAKTFRAIMTITPDSIAVRLDYFLHHRRWAKVQNATRFSEKIIRRKLYERDAKFIKYADKISAKDHVCSKLGKEWVAPLIWSGEKLPPRERRDWPIPFVVKINNSSGTNIFVRSADLLDWSSIENRCQSLLTTSHGKWAGEWVYKAIKPAILVEAYVGNIETLPWDYKLFVFGGKVKFIEVDTDREVNHKRTFFDTNWIRQDFSLKYEIDLREIPCPVSLNKMIRAAELLAENIPFVRIDFYEIEGRPLFGEMTFYPDSGTAKFSPDIYDITFGLLWK